LTDLQILALFLALLFCFCDRFDHRALTRQLGPLMWRLKAQETHESAGISVNQIMFIRGRWKCRTGKCKTGKWQT